MVKSKLISKSILLGIYQHYKGKFYEVIALARHSETVEEMVVYKALYKTKFGIESLWVRPRKMFEEKIKMGKVYIPRFKLIREKK